MVKETETEEGRKQVAEHVLLDASGNEADTEENATGIRYKLLENSKTFEWQWAQATDAERQMLAIFGAKTLATNVTSAARNNKKNPADADTQFNELTERFNLIRSGQWIDRSREPGVPAIDKDKLAQAIAQVMLAGGKIAQSDLETTVAEKRKRLEDEKGYATFVRTNPQVAAAYNSLAARKVADINDL